MNPHLRPDELEGRLRERLDAVGPARRHVPDAETCTAILERAGGREVEGPVVVALGTRMRARRHSGGPLEGRGSGPPGAARHGDAVLHRREFIFPQPKTSRARRSVDLPTFVMEFLRRQRRVQAEQKMRVRDVWSDYGVVVSDPIGQPLAPWTVSADFRRLVAELGLPKTRFHDLRHAHATQLLAAGVHPRPSANGSDIPASRSRWTPTRQ